MKTLNNRRPVPHSSPFTKGIFRVLTTSAMDSSSANVILDFLAHRNYLEARRLKQVFTNTVEAFDSNREQLRVASDGAYPL